MATGIGIFGLVFKEEGGTVKALLRRRLERDSLYQQDLSGRWELVGGGMELVHFQEVPRGEYQEAIWRTLRQELMEEAGLELLYGLNPLALFPAFLQRGYTDRGESHEERLTIDLAFVTPLAWAGVKETDEFQRKMERGELHFFSKEELNTIEIVSPRTKFLIERGFDAYSLKRWGMV